MKITPMTQSLVLHFGEMGSRWGLNRTLGQMYALIVLTEAPLNADQISEALQISRSNVSMGLKELKSWNLIKLQHIPGDRKEYFSAPSDIWEIARTLVLERRKRELDPTLSTLRDALMEQATSEADQYAQMRVKQMHDLLEMVTLWTTELQGMSSDKLAALLKLGEGISKLLDVKDKLLLR
ncbi:DNA-binding transcriptional regulator GbsR, MarR family [Colwellia chukchiensis]|uniref:HTH-type transcriptional regulator n=1 Tax=Colwellia chukchiensis TaxID=641665 RepID=A0A1H7N464_9GAMM|nr:GbsR/MarR family transcriptional regulator [Colwellia chukchiensis]SEL18109.1 DNA-binding transcriptional regulator GbsR, MarR family [Colwellia chukchiensis]